MTTNQYSSLAPDVIAQLRECAKTVQVRLMAQPPGELVYYYGIPWYDYAYDLLDTAGVVDGTEVVINMRVSPVDDKLHLQLYDTATEAPFEVIL